MADQQSNHNLNYNQYINQSPNKHNRNTSDSLERRSVERSRDKLKFQDHARNIVLQDQRDFSSQNVMNNNANINNHSVNQIDSPQTNIKINPMLQNNCPLDETIIFDKNSPVGMDFNNLEAKQYAHADSNVLNIFTSINAQRPGFMNFLGNKKQDANQVLSQQRKFKEPMSDILISNIKDEQKIDIV